jgi:hypothetical protein
VITAAQLQVLFERASFERSGAMLAAAAGALIRSTEPLALRRAVASAQDPGVALVVAAGAAVERGPSGFDTACADDLAALARAVPGPDRLLVLSVAEALLTRLDPIWAWEMIVELVGARPAVEAAIGLDVAARISLDRVSTWSPGIALPAAVARQLSADETARAAVAGRVTSRDDPRLRPLVEQPIGAELMPSEARVLLAAAAAVDPLWALDLSVGLLTRFAPGELLEAFRLVARALVRAGLSSELDKRVRTEGYVSEQATWLAAAASAGPPDVADLVKTVRQLAERVEDELDPGRELVAGLPLLEALAHAHETRTMIELAERWHVPPPLLVDRLFHAGAAAAAAQLLADPELDLLLNRPESAWATTYAYRFGWWTGASSDQDDRARVLHGALAVVAAQPWRPQPGSLADVIGWK